MKFVFLTLAIIAQVSINSAFYINKGNLERRQSYQQSFSRNAEFPGQYYQPGEFYGESYSRRRAPEDNVDRECPIEECPEGDKVLVGAEQEKISKTDYCLKFPFVHFCLSLLPGQSATESPGQMPQQTLPNPGNPSQYQNQPPAPPVYPPMPAPQVYPPIPPPQVYQPIPAPSVYQPMPAPPVYPPIPPPQVYPPIPPPQVYQPMPHPQVYQPLPAPSVYQPMPAPTGYPVMVAPPGNPAMPAPPHIPVPKPQWEQTPGTKPCLAEHCRPQETKPGDKESDKELNIIIFSEKKPKTSRIYGGSF